MKKLIVIAFCTGMFTTAKSQVYVQGGVNLANITKTNSGATEKNNMLTTFNAGILGRMNLSTTFDLETGLLLDGRGSKSDMYLTSSTSDNYVKAKFNPLYLEVPLNVVLRIPLESSTNIFVNAGPYAAFGIAGKSKTDSKIAGVTSSSSTNIKFTDADPNAQDQAYDKLKRWDYGVNLGAGIDLGKILLKANYGMGFAKISSKETNNSSNDKNKYRTVSISLGIPISRS
jgi:hypothetical protein